MLQEWMGHRDFKTTLIYADYQPLNEAEFVERTDRRRSSARRIAASRQDPGEARPEPAGVTPPAP